MLRARLATRSIMSSRQISTTQVSTKVTYASDSSLPELPIPSLEQTAAKYLASTIPVHTDPSPSATSAVLPSYAVTEKLVNEFFSSPLAQTLQARLHELADQKVSWLREMFDEGSYLGWRGPVAPWVNYFYSHKDDKARRDGPSRAAALTLAMLAFRKLLVLETLEPEMARKAPLCMKTYPHLFNATRLPTSPSDSAKIYEPSTHNYVVVVRKNKFYEVPILGSDGEFLSEKDLEAMFRKVNELAGDFADPNPVGALTAADRDVWTKARGEIIAHSPANAATLERIQGAIIMICLDSGKPITREETSRSLWVGDGMDRWFDKHQLIVFENGKSGFNGEHAFMDGTPTSRLNDFLLRSLAAGKIPLGSLTPSPPSSLPTITPLALELPSNVISTISTAISVHQELMEKHDLSVLQYDGYGKDLIKTFKVSPDSYTQLVMALAYYKMTGVPAMTYESAQTRKYQLGRTEVIRTATAESLEWCKAMETPSATAEQKYALLQKAAAKHITLANEAADGQGIDRHFMGLKHVLKADETMPAFFSDPAFAKSSHWSLSTSQLTSEFFEGWGYGEVVEDGYGLAYAVNNKSLRFTITSMNKSPKSAQQFRQYLEEACTETREAVEKGLLVAKL